MCTHAPYVTSVPMPSNATKSQINDQINKQIKEQYEKRIPFVSIKHNFPLMDQCQVKFETGPRVTLQHQMIGKALAMRWIKMKDGAAAYTNA